MKDIITLVETDVTVAMIENVLRDSHLVNDPFEDRALTHTDYRDLAVKIFRALP